MGRPALELRDGEPVASGRTGVRVEQAEQVRQRSRELLHVLAAHAVALVDGDHDVELTTARARLSLSGEGDLVEAQDAPEVRGLLAGNAHGDGFRRTGRAGGYRGKRHRRMVDPFW